MNCKDIFCQEAKLEWTSDPFLIHGITFNVNLESIAISSFNGRLNEIYKPRVDL